MCFLRTRFENTNWQFIFPREEASRAVMVPAKYEYRSKSPAIYRRGLLDAGRTCHYENTYHDGAVVIPEYAVCMKDNASEHGELPKWRKVCSSCCDRMDNNSLLSIIERLLPAQEDAGCNNNGTDKTIIDK